VSTAEPPPAGPPGGAPQPPVDPAVLAVTPAAPVSPVHSAAPGGAAPASHLPQAPLGPPPLPPGRSLAWRVVQWPLTRLILALALVVAVEMGTGLLFRYLQVGGHLPPGMLAYLRRLGVILTAVVAMHWTYRGYTRWIEWRRAGELSLVGAVPEALRGLLIGAGLMSCSVGVLWLAGFYHVTGVRSPVEMLPALAMAVISGYGEELLTRVILFRIVEESLGTGWALAVTGGLFGLAHWHNPHATLVSGISISLAGVLLGSAYALTRRIWLAAGLHFGWNFFQGGVYGVAVSGTAGGGLLAASLSGPPALSGGEFGVEGSVLAVVVCAVAAVPLLAAAARRGNVLPPVWSARRAAGAHAAG
jgi:membrane protease YdiL (CAAX protease family)